MKMSNVYKLIVAAVILGLIAAGCGKRVDTQFHKDATEIVSLVESEEDIVEMGEISIEKREYFIETYNQNYDYYNESDEEYAKQINRLMSLEFAYKISLIKEDDMSFMTIYTEYGKELDKIKNK